MGISNMFISKIYFGIDLLIRFSYKLQKICFITI